MAEAFAALGIAASIFQFLELGFKATQTIITTYRDIDIDGLALHNAEIALTCSDFEDHCSRLKNAKAAGRDAALDQLLTRCINTATKLSTEVGSLRIPDSKRRRRRTKVKMTIISYWKSNTIDSLQADLVDIRAQICFRLQGLIYEHHRSLVKSVDAWGEASKEWNKATEQKLDAMAQQVKELLKSESGTGSGGVNELAQTLAAFAEEAKNHGINRAILESLHFAQIKERQNEIPKAHKDTFKWIFNENGPGNFGNWLRESSGIFWITGKPGSGKSTLMKFISGHETTKNLATTWASPKPLLLASHFFWFGGTKLQKSQEGLLRTLLFQVLSNAPELISKVFPDRVSGQFQYLESWSLEELSDAFERLQALPTIPCRIFILVDGLDEYSGQGTEVTEFLHAITKSPEIKVCCASRPWQEFRDAFRTVFGQIQMHDLTSADMRAYVQSTLRENERFKTLQSSQEAHEESLIDSICMKAEGVFFWVSLVMKSLVRGLNKNDGLETLQRRVSEFPPDLDEFFQRMIDSIEDVYKTEVFGVFSTLLMTMTPLPLHLFEARDSRLMQDVAKTINLSYERATTPPYSSPDKMGLTGKTVKKNQFLTHGELSNGDFGLFGIIRTISVRENAFTGRPEFKDQLLSRCRDLVQAWQATDSDPSDIRVGFLHRTVVEFLQRKENQSAMGDHHVVLGRYLLARSCLSVFYVLTNVRPSSIDPGPMDTTFVLWFLYILQETEAPTDDLAQADGYMIFRLCEELIRYLHNRMDSVDAEDDNVDGILRLLSLAQARILVQKYQFESKHSETNYIQCYEDRNSDTILRYALRGWGQVEVEDRPMAFFSKSIDLDLLDNLLQIDGIKKHIVQTPDSDSPYPQQFRSVWETFVWRLGPRKDRSIRNEYEACEIMIKNGAARMVRLNNDHVHVDLVEFLSHNETFPEEKIVALEGLFPPDVPADQLDVSADQTPSKKKRRKRAYRKGKSKR